MSHFPSIVAALVLTALAILSPSAAGEIRVAPAEGLLGDPASIRVAGLKGGQRVAIEATMTDTAGVVWTSRGVYRADADGVVDPAQQPSVNGTYSGVDPAGLFWSMVPLPAEQIHKWGEALIFDPDTPRGPKLDADKPHAIVFRAYTPSHPALEPQDFGEARYVRRLRAADIEETPVREGRIRGVLFEPAGGGDLPAVIVIGGSGGGVMRSYAGLLASHGLRVFALGWFSYEDLPADGANIPLEYFAEAIDWYRGYAGKKKIGFGGISYGGMTTLMVASTYPEHIGAVFAGVPAHVHGGGVIRDLTKFGPTLTLGGAPLAFVNTSASYPQTAEESKVFWGHATARTPMRTSDIYLKHWNDPALSEDVIIPVENIDAPLFITAGEDDGMWYSAVAGDRIVARLKKKGFDHDVIYRRTDAAGHFVDYPRAVMNETALYVYHPVAKIWIANGGEAAAMARAQRENFPALVSFFKENLE